MISVHDDIFRAMLAFVLKGHIRLVNILLNQRSFGSNSHIVKTSLHS
jgi:hypothetical protein